MTLDSWIRDTIEMWVAEFLETVPSGSVDAGLRPIAEELLITFLWQACAVRGVAPVDLERGDLKEAFLEGIQGVPVSEKARRAVPGLLRDFLADLERRGRLADGEMHGLELAAMHDAYLASVEAKPRPVVRPGAKIGRNDPCPCGSGRKYKKCCGRSAD